MEWEEGSASPIRTQQSSFEFAIDHLEYMLFPVGSCISSPTFTAGGYEWALDYYPRGNEPENYDYVSVFLVLKSDADDISVEYSFKVLSRGGEFVNASGDTNTFSSHDSCKGFEQFFVRDNLMNFCGKRTLVLSCNIIVLNEQQIVENYSGGLHEHIGKLWEKGERFDVTFEVEGETISAHRLILAARSPVFEATFFGHMAETNMERIKIDEMKAVVFKALLHFVYTDELALYELSDDAIYESGDDEKDSETLLVEHLQGLFAAANRYALDKLTFLCERQLLKNLSVDMVATTLILADQHSRTSLKMKCLDFASSPDNFSLVALTDGYLEIMQGHPTLFAELSEKVKGSSPFKDKLAKKQKASN